MAHKCNNCDTCKILKKKVEIYERCMKDLKELREEEKEIIDLEQSVILEKDNFGNLAKKIPSDLSESILVVDKGKKLSELSKKEQAAIKEQDNYYAYDQTKNITSQASTVYKATYYALSICKWVMVL